MSCSHSLQPGAAAVPPHGHTTLGYIRVCNVRAATLGKQRTWSSLLGLPTGITMRPRGFRLSASTCTCARSRKGGDRRPSKHVTSHTTSRPQ